MKKYTVIRIEEPDFGCEGRPDGQPIMDTIILQENNGSITRLQYGDALLYTENINEGDTVFITEDGALRKTES